MEKLKNNFKYLNTKIKMLFCYICKEYTESIEPYVIKRVGDRFALATLCKNCSMTKNRFLTNDEMELLPLKSYNLPKNTLFINHYAHKGKTYNFHQIMGKYLNL